MTDHRDYSLHHWGRYETDADHAARVESAEDQAGWYFAQATKPQKAAYDEAMAGLRLLSGPRYERMREAAKARWTRSTVEASELFFRTANAVMEFGEVPEALSAEWDLLCAKQQAREAA